MGTGYTRNDTSNNIADGNIINAADLDGEFDAIESAFGTSGHTHDGTSAEGGPITVLGPVQDFVASATEIKPKTTNTLDIGTSALLFKDLFLDGVATLGSIKIDNAGTIGSASDGDAIAISSGGVVSFSQNTIGKTGSGYVLSLQTSDTTIEATNVLGKIEFSAPDEASGTDAILVGASIEALAEDTFSSSVNSTALVFKTNTTGAATERMRLTSAGDLHFLDNRKAIFGAGSDLQIYHDGSNSIIKDTGAGDLRIMGSDDVRIVDSVNEDNMARFNRDGAVTLYYDNAAKFDTTSTGIDVTGTVTADGLTVADSSPTIVVQDSDGTNQTGTLRQGGQSTILSSRNDAADGIIKFMGNGAGSETERMRISSNGDISFFEDTGTTAKFLWDASAESLTIGSTSADNVTIYSTDDVPRLEFEQGGTVYADIGHRGASAGARQNIFEITTKQSEPIAFRTANTERMRITSAGNVGIGTDSPSTSLHVSTSDENVATFASTDTAARIVITDGTDTGYVNVSSGKVSLGQTLGLSASNLNITSTGAVGIGTTSPTAVSGTTVLEITGTSGNAGAEVIIGSSDTTATANDLFGGLAFKSIDSNGTPPHYSGIKAIAADTFGGASLAFYAGRSNYENNDPRFVIEGPQSVSGEAMRIDSSGNVGIGTTSPSGALHVSRSGLEAGITLERTTSATAKFTMAANDGNLVFTDQNQSAERMRIDSSGNVGFGGVTSPQAGFGVSGCIDTNGAYFTRGQIAAHQTNAAVLQYGANLAELRAYGATAGSGQMRFMVGGGGGSADSEAMRIDSSGNLLVGTTDNLIWNEAATDNSKEGVVIEPKSLQISRYQDTQALFNRQGNSGTNLVFAQDGAEVGSIVTSSGLIGLNNGNTALTVDDSTNSIHTRLTNGTLRDGSTSLGKSDSRFEDLYLSGGVYLGGTGAANLLDDYEEGTWSPKWVNASNQDIFDTAPSVNMARYTKIGDTVIAFCYFNNPGSAFGNTAAYGASNPVYVGGLPFISNRNGSNDFYGGTIGWHDNWTGWTGGTPMCYTNNNGTTITLVYSNGANSSNIQQQYVDNTGSGIILTVSYKTTS